MPQSSGPEYFLQSSVHMAWRDDDIVLLNIDTDEYACIVDGGSSILPGPKPGTVSVPDPTIALDMRRAGLLGQATPLSRRAPPRLPGQALGALDSVAILGTLHAGLSGLESKMRFSRSSFAELVAPPRYADKESLRATPMGRAARALTAFEAVHPWLPNTGECLQRAFMLRFHLQRSRVAADWVFGVRTWPFLAHCWIQIDDTVVGDTVERVRGFTPILVV